MRPQLRALLLGATAMVVSACAGIVGPTAQEMTLQSRNVELSTQISDLRQTATVETNRMMITVEHASTEVRSVGFQRDALRATLIARGTDAGFVDVTAPNSSDDLPDGIDSASLLPTPGPGSAAPPAVTPAGAGDDATLDQSQVAAGTATPAAEATGPRLTDPVLATGVNNNDCAANSQTSFPSSTQEIYIVATALDFPVGTTVTARWSQDGTVLGTYEIPFDFAIDGACIWAFIDQTDFAFTPGNWTVELLVNGSPGLGPIPFTITGTGTGTGAGGEATGDNMDDMSEGG